MTDPEDPVGLVGDQPYSGRSLRLRYAWQNRRWRFPTAWSYTHDEIRLDLREGRQQPRLRRACFGELIQIDGSDHRWFEQRAGACVLLVFTDDATGQIVGMRFCESESTFEYMQITKRYLLEYGKPVAFYSDKHSVFRNNKVGATRGDGLTQFGRALHDLNIESICANSAPAKGRVERANSTLQDRLVKELRLEGVSR